MLYNSKIIAIRNELPYSHFLPLFCFYLSLVSFILGLVSLFLKPVTLVTHRQQMPEVHRLVFTKKWYEYKKLSESCNYCCRKFKHSSSQIVTGMKENPFAMLRAMISYQRGYSVNFWVREKGTATLPIPDHVDVNCFIFQPHF